MYEAPLILILPPGNITELGLYFSKTVPCEINKIRPDSPIFYSSLQYVGCRAYHLSIPNKIDIYGALDNHTLETILLQYSNVANRTLIFKKRGDDCNQGLVTTTVLPTGPIGASFRSSRGLATHLRRVLVEKAPPGMNCEFPIGHFVKKVIIPNQLVLEGGLRKPDRLLQTLDDFAEVPGRKIVFQRNIPKGGIVTKVILPEGPTGVAFDDKLGLPVVSAVYEHGIAARLNIPVGHFVEKLIIPNEIVIERMQCETFEKNLKYFSQLKRRVIVLQQFRNNILRIGTALTITLPNGWLGVVFHSRGGYISVAEVNEDSRMKGIIPVGYTVESLTTPGEMEIERINEMDAATFTKKLDQFSHIPYRIMVLKQFSRDIIRKGTASAIDEHG